MKFEDGKRIMKEGEVDRFLRLNEEQKTRGRHWKGLVLKKKRFRKLLEKIEGQLMNEMEKFPKNRVLCKRLKHENGQMKLEVTKLELEVIEQTQEKEILEYELLKVKKKRKELEEMYLASLQSISEVENVDGKQNPRR